MTHKHTYLPFAKDVVGYWQKRDCPGDETYFIGRIEKCEEITCGKKRFIPNDKNLYPVEVE